MKKIFVTGAGGFIGSHLTEALVQKGYDVKALAYYNALGSEEWLDHIAPDIREKIEVVSGDVRDLSFVRRSMQGCTGVLHLAALIGIPYSYVNPESYIDTNIKGTMNILEAARDLDIQKIIHTSTSEVYGTAIRVPIDEEHPLQGQSPYSASKIAADQMAYAYACSFDLPVLTIRPFNTYGPRQSMRAVIPTVIMQLMNGDGTIKLGATDPTRDFNYVDDTVNGFITALENKDTSLHSQTINIGSNFEISIGDTVELIGEIIGKPVTIQSDTNRMRPGGSEVERLWCDNAKAKKLLNWSPNYAGKDGFKRGLEKTIEWFSDPKNREHYTAAHRYVV